MTIEACPGPQKPSAAWGDRSTLLPKRAVYVFSVDVRVESRGHELFKSSEQPSRAIRHLFSDSMVTTPLGARVEVPTGEIRSADGKVGDELDPRSNWFSLRVVGDVGANGAAAYLSTVHFDLTGVLDLVGGMGAFHRPKQKTLTGLAFVASSQDPSTAAYRWLERRQLFGIGRVQGEKNLQGGWELRFTFDMYAPE